MGVKGLRPYMPWREADLVDYRGRRVGVDGFLWLFQAISAYIGVLRRDNLSRSHVPHFVNGALRLLDNGIMPVIVFDGVFPPARHARQRSGAGPAPAAAALPVVRAVEVEGVDAGTAEKASPLLPLLAKIVVDAFQEHEDARIRAVQFITTPYEADAQLAYLASLPPSDPHHVHAVVTEDSDLLAFGVQRVLFKFKPASNRVREVCVLDVLEGKKGLRCGVEHPLVFGRPWWTLDKFQAMCVLCGCEYLDNVPDVGLKTAHELMSECSTWQAAVAALRRRGGVGPVPEGYEQRFQRALWYFKHAVVYSPGQRKLVHLTPLPEGGLVMPTFVRPAQRQQQLRNGNGDGGKRRKLEAEAQQQQDSSTSGEESGGGEETDDEGERVQDEEGHDVLGRLLPDDVAQGIAEGRLNPVTRQPFALPPLVAVGGQGPLRASGRSVLGGAGAAAAGGQEGSGDETDDPEDRMAEKE